MARNVFSNNASTTLAAGLNETATTLNVAAGTGVRFPEVTPGVTQFYATLENAEADREVVRVTAVAGDVFTVDRGVDGTQARAWSTGDRVELRLVSAVMDRLVQTVNGEAGDVTITPDNIGAVSQTEFDALEEALGDVSGFNIGAGLEADEENLVVQLQDDGGLDVGAAGLFIDPYMSPIRDLNVPQMIPGGTGSLALDLDEGVNAHVGAFTGPRVLDAFTNAKVGDTGLILFLSIGSHTLSFSSVWKLKDGIIEVETGGMVAYAILDVDASGTVTEGYLAYVRPGT